MGDVVASVLVVDDDHDLRDLIADLLTIHGYDVRVACDGVQALQQLDVRFPQLVISDLEMPALDGKAFIYRMFIENLGRENIPVIMMSASTRLAQVADAAGTPYALAKPFPPRDLLALVTRALTEAIPPRPKQLVSLRS